MTVDGAVCTGERLRQRPENNRDRNNVVSGRAIRALAPVPALDWPTDLFTSVIVGDDALDSELEPIERPRVLGHQPLNQQTVPPLFGDNDPGTVIWRCRSAHASTLAVVGP